MSQSFQGASLEARSAETDKRVFLRVPCLVDLDVEREPSGLDRVEAIDLSLLGVGFQQSGSATVRFEPGDTVTVGISGLRPLNAKVRWKSGRRVGVQFCGRFPDIVDSWVGEVLSTQGVRVQDLVKVN